MDALEAFPDGVSPDLPILPMTKLGAGDWLPIIGYPSLVTHHWLPIIGYPNGANLAHDWVSFHPKC